MTDFREKLKEIRATEQERMRHRVPLTDHELGLDSPATHRLEVRAHLVKDLEQMLSDFIAEAATFEMGHGFFEGKYALDLLRQPFLDEDAACELLADQLPPRSVRRGRRFSMTAKIRSAIATSQASDSDNLDHSRTSPAERVRRGAAAALRDGYFDAHARAARPQRQLIPRALRGPESLRCPAPAGAPNVRTPSPASPRRGRFRFRRQVPRDDPGAADTARSPAQMPRRFFYLTQLIYVVHSSQVEQLDMPRRGPRANFPKGRGAKLQGLNRGVPEVPEPNHGMAASYRTGSSRAKSPFETPA